MALPRGSQVPFSSALSGIVLVVVMFSLSAPLHEAALLGAWALIYVVECVVRRRFSFVGIVRGVRDSVRRGGERTSPRPARRPSARAVGRYLLAAGSFVVLGLVAAHQLS